MPKATFFNLKENKRQSILKCLIKEFEVKTLSEATVKDIVKNLKIPRGSFYQYFESLEDAYFYILDLKFNKIHLAFLKIYEENPDNLQKNLLEYGDFLSEEIYKSDNYKLFHNRYLEWNSQLEQNWRKYQKSLKNDVSFLKTVHENKKLSYISWLVHILIQKLFLNEWSQETFIKEYNEMVQFIMKGINYVENI